MSVRFFASARVTGNRTIINPFDEITSLITQIKFFPEISEKGKPSERAGRKAMGPNVFTMAARPPVFR